MAGFVSPRLGIRFEPGAGPNNLAIIRPDGQPFLTYVELMGRAESERQRADEQARLAESERQRADEQAQLVESERQRADAPGREVAGTGHRTRLTPCRLRPP